MTLKEFNKLPESQALKALTKCCGSKVWAARMIHLKPFSNLKSLLKRAEMVWNSCGRSDWLEAFDQHPKIGEVKTLREKFTASKSWAESEQSGVNKADDKVLERMVELNEKYFRKFGFIFIVFATMR